jgi:diguanylate cyclase (GGDEF)-like protein
VHPGHFYEIRADQARWGILNLLLLFNGWLVYQQWWFRRLQGQETGRNDDLDISLQDAYDPSRVDRATGLHTSASFELLLGKEVARARRHNIPLSLVALHLDDFTQLNQRYGSKATDPLLREFANRLRKATRGTDFCMRLASDDFLLVLPECSLRAAKIVTDRLGTLKVKCWGQEITLTYSIGWIDYKQGDTPSDLVNRAEKVLQLYKKASWESVSTNAVGR